MLSDHVQDGNGQVRLSALSKTGGAVYKSSLQVQNFIGYRRP